MSAFEFPLEKIRKLREEQESETAKTLADARSDADGARQAMEDLESVRDAGRARVVEAHGSGGVVGHLQNLEYVLGCIDEQIDDAQTTCHTAEEHLVHSIEEFSEANQRRRTIDHLKARRLEAWKQHQRRVEQADSDEIAILRHAKGAAAGSGR